MPDNKQARKDAIKVWADRYLAIVGQAASDWEFFQLSEIVQRLARQFEEDERVRPIARPRVIPVTERREETEAWLAAESARLAAERALRLEKALLPDDALIAQVSFLGTALGNVGADWNEVAPEYQQYLLAQARQVAAEWGRTTQIMPDTLVPEVARPALESLQAPQGFIPIEQQRALFYQALSDAGLPVSAMTDPQLQSAEQAFSLFQKRLAREQANVRTQMPRLVAQGLMPEELPGPPTFQDVLQARLPSLVAALAPPPLLKEVQAQRKEAYAQALQKAGLLTATSDDTYKDFLEASFGDILARAERDEGLGQSVDWDALVQTELPGLAPKAIPYLRYSGQVKWEEGPETRRTAAETQDLARMRAERAAQVPLPAATQAGMEQAEKRRVAELTAQGQIEAEEPGFAAYLQNKLAEFRQQETARQQEAFAYQAKLPAAEQMVNILEIPRGLAAVPLARPEPGQLTKVYGGMPIGSIVGGAPTSTTDWLKQRSADLRAQFDEEKRQRQLAKVAAGQSAVGRPARPAVTFFQGAQRR